MQTPCKVELAGLCPYLPHSPQKVRSKPSVCPRSWQLSARPGGLWGGCSCPTLLCPVPRELPALPGQQLCAQSPSAPLPAPAGSGSACLEPLNKRRGATELQSTLSPAWGCFGVCTAAPCPKHARHTMTPLCLATPSCLRGKGKSRAEQGR